MNAHEWQGGHVQDTFLEEESRLFTKRIAENANLRLRNMNVVDQGARSNELDGNRIKNVQNEEFDGTT